MSNLLGGASVWGVVEGSVLFKTLLRMDKRFIPTQSAKNSPSVDHWEPEVAERYFERTIDPLKEN